MEKENISVADQKDAFLKAMNEYVRKDNESEKSNDNTEENQ